MKLLGLTFISFFASVAGNGMRLNERVHIEYDKGNNALSCNDDFNQVFRFHVESWVEEYSVNFFDTDDPNVMSSLFEYFEVSDYGATTRKLRRGAQNKIESWRTGSAPSEPVLELDSTPESRRLQYGCYPTASCYGYCALLCGDLLVKDNGDRRRLDAVEDASTTVEDASTTVEESVSSVSEESVSSVSSVSEESVSSVSEESVSSVSEESVSKESEESVSEESEVDTTEDTGGAAEEPAESAAAETTDAALVQAEADGNGRLQGDALELFRQGMEQYLGIHTFRFFNEYPDLVDGCFGTGEMEVRVRLYRGAGNAPA